MRYRRLCAELVVSAICALCTGSSGAELPVPEAAPRTLTVVTSVAPNEVRDYKADFQVSGKNAVSGSLSASVSYRLRHLYLRHAADEPLPLEITLQQGKITTQGQILDVTPSLYPKLTVLIDSDWRITDILGAAGSRFAQGLPGINYGNLIMLFYLVDGDKPHAVGDSWQTKIALPSLGQEYRVVNTLKGIETVNGIEAAKVAQRITGTPESSMTCTVESLFSMKNGKLLRSHSNCEVDLPPDSLAPLPPDTKERGTERVVVGIDIAVVQ